MVFCASFATGYVRLEDFTVIETLSFLGPIGPVARDANSCIYCDSKHAAGICYGTTHVRTHVQQSMLKVQYRLRLTMQHVYGWNLGNECAHHAAALGAAGMVSSHNLSKRWTHHSFDTASCFASCNNIGNILEKLHDIRPETTSMSQHQNGI